jgi:hypothetical protein
MSIEHTARHAADAGFEVVVPRHRSKCDGAVYDRRRAVWLAHSRADAFRALLCGSTRPGCQRKAKRIQLEHRRELLKMAPTALVAVQSSADYRDRHETLTRRSLRRCGIGIMLVIERIARRGCACRFAAHRDPATSLRQEATEGPPKSGRPKKHA